jgi:hypothetical protein
MSMQMSMRTAQRKVPLARRAAARLAAAAARPLARLRPRRLEQLLVCLRAGAAPATYDQALAAHDAVVAAAAHCAGIKQCLRRSIAICLLCRLYGTWPTWCTGVRTGPFRVHAWVEAEGRAIGEIPGIEDYSRLMRVPPAAVSDSPGPPAAVSDSPGPPAAAAAGTSTELRTE